MSKVTSERGMVIVEAAIAIPVLLAVAMALSWGLALGGTALSLSDAARQVARDVARGVDSATAVATVHRALPEARIDLRLMDQWAQVIVTQDVAGPAPLLSGVHVTLTQTVLVPREWT